MHNETWIGRALCINYVALKPTSWLASLRYNLRIQIVGSFILCWNRDSEWTKKRMYLFAASHPHTHTRTLTHRQRRSNVAACQCQAVPLPQLQLQLASISCVNLALPQLKLPCLAYHALHCTAHARGTTKWAPSGCFSSAGNTLKVQRLCCCICCISAPSSACPMSREQSTEYCSCSCSNGLSIINRCQVAFALSRRLCL